MEIWPIILKTNTFNFIVFAVIFAIIFKKIDVKAKLTAVQEKVKSLIEEAKKEKQKSLDELKKAEDKVKNLENEVKDLIYKAEVVADRISTKIMRNAELQVKTIGENTEKVLDAEKKKLVSSLSHNTSLASLELAKNHVKDTLSNKPYYHAKFIEDSINELDRL